MIASFDTTSADDYRRFLKIKSLPQYRITGRSAWYPDEYDSVVTGTKRKPQFANWEPSPFLFDYQRDITRLAIRKKKFAAFVDCGFGKTLIMIEYANSAAESLRSSGKRVLIVSPVMVIPQTISENVRWYADTGRKIVRVKASELDEWIAAPDDGTIGITNYDAIHDDLSQGNIGALILDESGMLKSHYGKWGQTLIRIGRGLEYKLCLTGVAAPNDRIEYANHAVFLDHFPTVNAFLARFFVNRGQTDNRWELKPHALEPFYRSLSHWSIFMTNPATYGWKDNAGTIPPINVSVDHVELTKEQEALIRKVTGKLVVTSLGGITSRSVMAQLAKGIYRGETVATNKFEFIRGIVDRDPKSTIIWCHYNDEQSRVEDTFPNAANIDGSTPLEKRIKLIDEFKSWHRSELVSKPKILGFGLNLQIARRQIFSGLQDSYEEYYQAVKRSNRVGSTEPLEVRIPVTEVERPMIDTVLRKADMIAHDTIEQERIFKRYAQDTLAF